MSLLGLLRNFGLKDGTISKSRFEARICELGDGNDLLEELRRRHFGGP